MAGSAEILAAIRELANLKQIERTELTELLRDGIHAALAKKHGPTVQAEVEVDEDRGEIRIVLLKTVVESVVEDPAAQITLEEARYEDGEYEIGDIMEIPVDFAEFGRSAVQAAKQRIIQRVREGERTKIRDEFSGRVGDLLSRPGASGARCSRSVPRWHRDASLARADRLIAPRRPTDVRGSADGRTARGEP